MSKTLDDSWEKYPEAKIRMREDGLKTMLEGLGEEGFCIGSPPRVEHLEDGIYVEMLLNVGKHGSVIALPFEVFIPCKPLPLSKKKASKVEKQAAIKAAAEAYALEVARRADLLAAPHDTIDEEQDEPDDER